MIEYDIQFGKIGDLKLTHMENKLLIGLLQNTILTTGQVDKLYEKSTNEFVCRTRIHRLNEKLEGLFRIKNRRSYGYYIEQEDKDKIKVVGLHPEYKSSEYATAIKLFFEEELENFTKEIELVAEKFKEKFKNIT